MRTTLCAVVVGIGIILAVSAQPLSAHHAFSSEFDAKKPVKFEGTVTKMMWINPHAWIYVDVKKADGTTEEWMVEAGKTHTPPKRGVTQTPPPARATDPFERPELQDTGPPPQRRRLTH